jgi:hypothetical protein
MKHQRLTQAEINEARLWWNRQPESVKGGESIWTILALYAQHWREVHTVSFDSAEKATRITES